MKSNKYLKCFISLYFTVLPHWLCSLLHLLLLMQTLNGCQGPRPGEEGRELKRTQRPKSTAKPLSREQIQKDIPADCMDSQRNELDTVSSK